MPGLFSAEFADVDGVSGEVATAFQFQPSFQEVPETEELEKVYTVHIYRPRLIIFHIVVFSIES